MIHINGAPHPLRRADRRFPRYLCASAPRRFACRDNAGHEDDLFLCEIKSRTVPRPLLPREQKTRPAKATKVIRLGSWSSSAPRCHFNYKGGQVVSGLLIEKRLTESCYFPPIIGAFSPKIPKGIPKCFWSVREAAGAYRCSTALVTGAELSVGLSRS